MALRLYYLRLLGDGRPQICPLFFQVDLIPPTMQVLNLSEGVCYFIVLIIADVGERSTQCISAFYHSSPYGRLRHYYASRWISGREINKLERPLPPQMHLSQRLWSFL